MHVCCISLWTDWSSHSSGLYQASDEDAARFDDGNRKNNPDAANCARGSCVSSVLFSFLELPLNIGLRFKCVSNSLV